MKYELINYPKIKQKNEIVLSMLEMNKLGINKYTINKLGN